MVRHLPGALREHGLRLVVASSASKDDLGAPVAATARIGPEAAMLIGDTCYDIEAARRPAVPCVAVRCGAGATRDWPGAVAIYRDPADLLDHLVTSPIGARLGLAPRASTSSV